MPPKKAHQEVFTGDWYPWYPEKALTAESIDHLTLAEEGAYRRAIDKAWLKGSLPRDPAECARVIGRQCTVKIAKRILEIALFKQMPGNRKRVIHTVLERIRAEQKERHDRRVNAGRAGGAQKSGKKKENHSKSSDSDQNVEANEIQAPNSIAQARENKQCPTDIDRYIEEEKKEEEESNTTLSVIPEISTAVAETAPTPPPAPPVKELPIEIFFGLTLSGLSRRMGVKTLPNPSDWQKHLRWAFANGFSPDDVVECYDHMKQQSWRENAITPKALVAELPNLNDLRSPKPPVPTGRKNGTASGRERSATDSEFGYAAADELERRGLERRAAEADERDRIRRGLLGEGSQDGPEIDLIG